MTDRIRIAVFKNPVAKHDCVHEYVPATKRVASGFIAQHICKHCGHERTTTEHSKFHNVLKKKAESNK